MRCQNIAIKIKPMINTVAINFIMVDRCALKNGLYSHEIKSTSSRLITYHIIADYLNNIKTIGSDLELGRE